MTRASSEALQGIDQGQVPSAYHRLHTMRCIGKREDALCEMMHELKDSSGVSDEQAGELRSILEHLPSQDYLDDLRSVTDLLDEPPRKSNSQPKRAAKSVANQSVRKKVSGKR